MTEMCSSMEVVCEEVTGINDNRDMSNFDSIILMKLVNIGFMKINVFGAFVCSCCSPIDHCLIVIVDFCAFKGISHTKILCLMANALKLSKEFVSGNNFSFTGDEGSMVLADGFPSDRPHCPVNNKS